MSERPILFNTAMVKAILGGRKTQTRRIIKPPFEIHHHTDGLSITHPKQFNGEYCRFHPYNPPNQIGDTLWVRETWAQTWTPDSNEIGFIYKADGIPQKFPYWGNEKHCKDEVWIPSIHMPREAARLFLTVNDVRVERLQDIESRGAWNEGVNCKCMYPVPECAGNRKEFAKLWDGIYKSQGYGWADNPWVWVIEFERVV